MHIRSRDLSATSLSGSGARRHNNTFKRRGMKMEAKRILTFLPLLIFCHLAIAGVGDRYVFQITNNSYDNRNPRISGSKIVWEGYPPGSIGQVFIYDHDSNTTKLLSEAAEEASAPAISGGNVVWVSNDGALFNIMFYDGTATTKLNSGVFWNGFPQVSGSRAVWVRYEPDEGEIMLYSHKPCPTTTQLTDDDYLDAEPQIYNGYVVWTRSDGNDEEIFFYDGSAIMQITNNNLVDSAPQVCWVEGPGPVVTWQWYDGNDNEISVAKYNGINWVITRLTNNNYYDYYPQISGSHVVWYGWDGHDYEIFLYDVLTSTTTPLTNNSYDDRYPQISGSNVVWAGYDGNDFEIFHYDIGTGSTTQITHNNYDDDAPYISGDNIVWSAYKDSYSEIFGFLPSICSPPLAGDLNKDCKIDFVDIAMQASEWLSCHRQPQSLCSN
jgi:beta propeller repeat protein